MYFKIKNYDIQIIYCSIDYICSLSNYIINQKFCKNVLAMKISKKVKTEIINDIINFLNFIKDEKVNDFYHIDNLREEIRDQPENFSYKLEQFNFVYSNLFR